MQQEKNKTILHVIDSLACGGTEILLKNTVNLLPEFKHVVVILYSTETLKQQFNPDTKFINLGHKGWKHFFRSIRRLNRVIKQEQAGLIHSHLFLSTLCARLAKPNNFRLFSTIHSTYSEDAFNVNRLSLWLERLTSNRTNMLIGVSKFVLDDYLSYIPYKGKTDVIYNFLPAEYFKESNRGPVKNEVMRCIAVGNLKTAKNYPYLLEIFDELKGENISLDIYGEGFLRSELQQKIDAGQLPVRLCGSINNIKDVLKEYDLFIQASAHEGFGISVIEAMAAGIPVVLSDIPVFREITSGKSHFFPLNDRKSTAALILSLNNDLDKRFLYVKDAYEYCICNYSEESYRKKLISLYNEFTS